MGGFLEAPPLVPRVHSLIMLSTLSSKNCSTAYARSKTSFSLAEGQPQFGMW